MMGALAIALGMMGCAEPAALLQEHLQQRPGSSTKQSAVQGFGTDATTRFKSDFLKRYVQLNGAIEGHFDPAAARARPDWPKPSDILAKGFFWRLPSGKSIPYPAALREFVWAVPQPDLNYPENRIIEIRIKAGMSSQAPRQEETRAVVILVSKLVQGKTKREIHCSDAWSKQGNGSWMLVFRGVTADHVWKNGELQPPRK